MGLGDTQRLERLGVMFCPMKTVVLHVSRVLAARQLVIAALQAFQGISHFLGHAGWEG